MLASMYGEILGRNPSKLLLYCRCHARTRTGRALPGTRVCVGTHGTAEHESESESRGDFRQP